MNPLEKKVKAELEAIGYGVHRSGWPDFLITKDGLLHSVVEVKGYYDNVRPHQKQLHDILLAAGIKVHIVHETQLERFLWAMKETAPAQWSEPVSAVARLSPDYDPAGRAVDAAVDPALWDRVMSQPDGGEDDASQVVEK